MRMKFFRIAAFLIVVISGAGCRAPKLPLVSLNSPGWTVKETPALWRGSAKMPEIAGELLVAVNADGTRFIQFSKGGLPVVTAQQSMEGWRISSSLRSGVFGGRGSPPESILWFQLRSLPPETAPPWTVVRQENGSWTLTQSRTGETLEGLGAP